MERSFRKYLIYGVTALWLFSTIYAQQNSGMRFRRSGLHNANLVHTTFSNYGVIGQPPNGPVGAWKYDNNGYIGDLAPMVGAELSYFDSVSQKMKKFHSVVVCNASRPSVAEERSNSGRYWTFEPVQGYTNENQYSLAMSTDPNTWPSFWPDKLEDPIDPGWRGSWNSFMGKGLTNADQESFYVMNDNNDEEFNYAENNQWGVAFKPDRNNPMRNGLGFEVKVRGMQWARPLASDLIFWLYEVTNTGTTDYDRVTFGMLCGTYVGVSGGGADAREWDDDWSFFDVDKDLTYTGDFDNDCSRNPLWIGSVGMVGYAYLESPGNPYDGIDNDGDNCIEALPDGVALTFVAPKFEESDFDTVVYDVGDQIVLIDGNYHRRVVTIDRNMMMIYTRGMDDSLQLIAGETRFIEGASDENYNADPKAYDGIDNDLDGLIDENYLLHYRQVRKDIENDVVLFDEINPVCHIDYIGGRGLNDPLIDERRDDGIDNDGDWNPEFDDLGTDGIPNTEDYGEEDGFPTIGEANFDRTDVDESDQIGLTSFNYFSPASLYPMSDDEALWEWLQPGYFDVPGSIQHGSPTRGEDGDFIYGSAYFPLRAGETQRFSLALLYGDDLEDLLKNRKTAQKIYDSDYNFPTAPSIPTVNAVAGDGKVILYWDRKAEDSIDPVTRKKDFEGYRIYKATDSDFNDVMSVTDVYGNVVGYKYLAQFDLKNGIKGLFPTNDQYFQDNGGYTFDLGSDTGLRHTFVDEDVENGRRYFYAVTAYDHGEVALGMIPSETTKFITVQPDGEIVTDQNTVFVRPNPPVCGYDGANANTTLDRVAGVGTGNIVYDVIDETALTGNSYRVIFEDTGMDGIDNNGNWNALTDDIGSDGDPDVFDRDSTQNNGTADIGEPRLDWADPDEFAPITTNYSVLDLNGISETIEIASDFGYLKKKHIKAESFLISKLSDPHTYLNLDDFVIDFDDGKIKIKADTVTEETEFVVKYQYYPVYKSANIQGSPFADETFDTDIFDGVQLRFENEWAIDGVHDDSTVSFWNTGDRQYEWYAMLSSFKLGGKQLNGKPFPADLLIQFGDTIRYVRPDDLALKMGNYPAIQSNFRILNFNDSTEVPFFHAFTRRIHPDSVYTIQPKDKIYTFWKRPDGEYQMLWSLFFANIGETDTVYQFGDGDELRIGISKPFRNGDLYEFTTEKPLVQEEVARNEMDEIQVVPNPYITANVMESPLPPTVSSGRGERRIEFRKLPLDARVHIFSTDGSLVRTLRQSTDLHNGTIAWDLRSKENLDVAYGVYFYVVESSVGKVRGKLAIIK